LIATSETVKPRYKIEIKDESDFPVPITVSYETIDEVSDEGKGDYQELDPGHSVNNIEPGQAVRLGVIYGSESYRYDCRWIVNGVFQKQGDYVEFHVDSDMSVSLGIVDTKYDIALVPNPSQAIQTAMSGGVNMYTKFKGFYKDGRYCTLNPRPAGGYKFTSYENTATEEISTDPNYIVKPVYDNDGNPTTHPITINANYEFVAVRCYTEVRPVDGQYFGTATA